MKFTIPRDELAKPLHLVAGVVEKKHTNPILSNLLLVIENDGLSLTGTDSEMELIARVPLEAGSSDDGQITLPGKKLADIWKSLPDGAEVSMNLDDQKMQVKSGRSRFVLSTLPAKDFPNVEEEPGRLSIQVAQRTLKRLMERTAFAMAQQDVRYYLNGMLLEISNSWIRTVSTDGHRLAYSTEMVSGLSEDVVRIIIPRKGILELMKLMGDSDQQVTLNISNHHLQVITDDMTFTSKLLDGKFPDYERVIPRQANRTVYANRSELKQAFQRVAILSNEKFRGVRLLLDSNSMTIAANNPEQEEAEEVVSIEFDGDSLEIGFNVNYMLDVLSVLSGEQVKISLGDTNSSALIEERESGDSQYVVMPMRL